MTSVLFVDDEIQVLEGLRRNLQRLNLGWQLDFVTSAEHALQKIERGNIDVVVTDMRMTGMQGDEFIERIRKTAPNVIAIGLSGYCSREMEDHVNYLGSYLLPKPCDPNELVDVIESELIRWARPHPQPEGAAPERVFDGKIKLESYLLFLTGRMVEAGVIDATELPPAVASRLVETALPPLLDPYAELDPPPPPARTSSQDAHPVYLRPDASSGEEGWADLVIDARAEA